MLKSIKFETEISDLAKDLILNLLKYDPDERFSMKQIFNHSWMRQFENDYKITIDDFIWTKKEEL